MKLTINILLLTTLLTSGVSAPVHFPDAYDLTPEEEAALVRLATRGDNDSAFRLYRFKLIVKSERPEAYRWLVIAAENGHPIAQYNLGSLYLEDNAPNMERAMFWLKKAAELGDQEAKRKLAQLRGTE